MPGGQHGLLRQQHRHGWEQSTAEPGRKVSLTQILMKRFPCKSRITLLFPTDWLVSNRAQSTSRACTGRGGRETQKDHVTSRPAMQGPRVGKEAMFRGQRTVNYLRVILTTLLLQHTNTIMLNLPQNLNTRKDHLFIH